MEYLCEIHIHADTEEPQVASIDLDVREKISGELIKHTWHVGRVEGVQGIANFIKENMEDALQRKASR